MLGMHGSYQANMAMHNADLIIAIGARFDDRITNTPSKFAPKARIIHIDVDPASISKIINADIPIVGDGQQTTVGEHCRMAKSSLTPPKKYLHDVHSYNGEIMFRDFIEPKYILPGYITLKLKE